MFNKPKPKKKKILIVDDEAGFTHLVKLNLEATGRYEVVTENQGALGFQAAKVYKPDFIFLDIVMPDMEGSEVARQLDSDPELQKVPLVFLTATVTVDEVGPEGGTIGGHTFLAKPVETRQLIECIEKSTQG